MMLAKNIMGLVPKAGREDTDQREPLARWPLLRRLRWCHAPVTCPRVTGRKQHWIATVRTLSGIIKRAAAYSWAPSTRMGQR